MNVFFFEFDKTICISKKSLINDKIDCVSSCSIFGQKIYTWSKLEEVICDLNSMDFDHEDIMSQWFSAMARKMVRMKYSLEISIYAFEYYTTFTVQ